MCGDCFVHQLLVLGETSWEKAFDDAVETRKVRDKYPYKLAQESYTPHHFQVNASVFVVKLGFHARH